VGGETRRQKSLRIGVHLANGVVWGPVYRTHLTRARRRASFASAFVDSGDSGARVPRVPWVAPGTTAAAEAAAAAAAFGDADDARGGSVRGGDGLNEFSAAAFSAARLLFFSSNTASYLVFRSSSAAFARTGGFGGGVAIFHPAAPTLSSGCDATSAMLGRSSGLGARHRRIKS